MPRWFSLSDTAMEEALHDMALFHEFAQDIKQAHALLHSEEAVLFADSGYRGITKREEIQAQHLGVDWQVAMMPDKRRALKKSKTVDALIDKLEKIKASIRAKVEHPCRMIAPAAWDKAQKKTQSGQPTVVKSVKWMNQKNISSSGELLSINSRFCRGLFRASLFFELICLSH